MILNFNKTIEGSKEIYVAQIKATDAVNLHMERTQFGSIVIKQRGTSDGKWATTRAFSTSSAPMVFDSNLVSDVYPMYWRIEVGAPVQSATVTGSANAV